MSELISNQLDPNTVFLVSADRPGCGSSSVAEGLRDHFARVQDTAPHLISVGKMLREKVGATNESELQEKLGEINDPHHFDPQIYGTDLPDQGICIVDGKLATTAGPQHIEVSRPIVAINLTAPPIFSAKRILQREGSGIAQLFGEGPSSSVIDSLTNVYTREQHDRQMRNVISESEYPERQNQVTLDIDTSRYTLDEIVDTILKDTVIVNPDEAPEWEIDALNSTLKTLMTLGVDLRDQMHPRDLVHFNHQLETITYGIERLKITTNGDGLGVIRGDLKKAIVDCWYGLMLKRIPRFFISSDGGSGETTLTLDEETHSWSPEFYKVAEGWPSLSSILKGKSILDPFAGSGTLLNLLVARDVPNQVLYADISYLGGKDLNGAHNWYAPELNRQASQLLFDDLPSSYKPVFDAVAGYITSDAREIPLRDGSVDYIFGDPPYGKNLKSTGIGTLFGCLPEFQRVARMGSILLVPTSWIDELRAGGIHVKQLTKDLSKGTSNFPVCYILIESTADTDKS